MAVRLRCPWDSRSRNSLVSGFSRIICFLHSRQCAVPAYNVLKHQEIKQSFEVWCTLLFKLKAIEAKCHTAGYRECASQQIPTQVLLHNNKKWTNLEQLSPRDDDILGLNVCPRWFLPVTEQIKSQFELVAVVAHVNQQTSHFCCCDGHFHNAPAVLLLWWISPIHGECNTVHYLTSGTSVIVLSMPRAH